MATTLKTGRVPNRPTYRGLVRSIQFVTEGSSLVMRFDAARPSRIRAEPMGNNAVQVRIQLVSEEETIGSRPIGSEGEVVIPQQELQRGPVDSYEPGDSYELIFLKYADVSEVVGLLAEGAEIAPNDVFIRREPGFGSPGANQSTAYVGTQQRAERDEQPLGQNVGNGLAVDRRLNAIWVTGSPDRIERVKRQIELIDVPVDFAEPGSSIKSTWTGGGYNTISGTSMATPHFAGILLQGNPGNGGRVNGDPDGNPDVIGVVQ